MKQICLLSDTHGYLPENAFKYLNECDEIWHAGDFGPNVSEKLSSIKPLVGVYGNIDEHGLRLVHPEHQYMDVEGLKVLMIHIAGPFGKYTPQTRDLIKLYNPQVLICGHSHLLLVKKDKDMLYINPGAAGNHGFHKIKTLIRMTIESGRISKMDAVELGIRGTRTNADGQPL